MEPESRAECGISLCRDNFTLQQNLTSFYHEEGTDMSKKVKVRLRELTTGAKAETHNLAFAFLTCLCSEDCSKSELIEKALCMI